MLPGADVRHGGSPIAVALSEEAVDNTAAKAEGDKTAIGSGEVVLRVLSFLGIVIALILAMNALVGMGLRRVKTSSYGAWNEVMQGRVNADVIISGSSRAAYQTDPRVIEKVIDLSVFNLGRTGSQTDVQLAVLNAYLEHNRKPRLILHSLDSFSFVKTHEIFDPALYVPYLGDNEIYKPLHRIYPDLAKSRYIPLYGYVVEDMDFTWLMGLKGLVGIFPKEDFFLGFCPRDIKWTDDFDKYKRSNPNGVNFAIDQEGIQALEGLIKVCKENGIELVFVYSPEYTEMQAMTNNRTEIFAHFHDLTDKYHIPLWDYSAWKYAGDKEMFYNSEHLNAKGAAVFSSDLALRLKEHLFIEHKLKSDLARSGGPPSPNMSER